MYSTNAAHTKESPELPDNIPMFLCFAMFRSLLSVSLNSCVGPFSNVCARVLVGASVTVVCVCVCV